MIRGGTPQLEYTYRLHCIHCSYSLLSLPVACFDGELRCALLHGLRTGVSQRAWQGGMHNTHRIYTYMREREREERDVVEREREREKREKRV
jgi:hypothetical protein